MKCKDCPDRYVGCHTVCEYYIEYSRKREEMRHKRQMEHETNYALLTGALKRKEEVYRRKRNG